MTVSYVTPFRAFKKFVEFYPKLGAAIAFSAMDTAARMIPTPAGVRAASTDSAATSDAPQIAKGSELAPGSNSSLQKRNNSTTPRKRRAVHKTPRKTSKRARATGRRKAA
jgi:hypothetical protein